jgi:hypothetical protein
MSLRDDLAAVLPDDDPLILALPAAQRERVGAEWLRRAHVELTAATISAQIARGLLLDGATRDVQALASRAVADEVRHAWLCHAVAERYLGRAADPPRSRPVEEPAFGDCPPELNRLLGLVLHSCISETMAVVCLRSGVGLCRSPTARSATQHLLRDDVDHARLGWAHLASTYVSRDAKRHIERALPTLLRLGHESWVGEPRSSESDSAHGVLGRDGFGELTRSALTEIVLPGFDHVGVDARAGRDWLAKSAPAASQM